VNGPSSHPIERFFARWIALVQRRAWVVIVAAILLTVPLAAVVVGNLRVNVDSAAMMDPALAFRKALARLEQRFPELSDNLVFVIDAEAPELAREAAKTLVGRLRSESAAFDDVFAPAVDPFFERSGLLLLEPGALGDTTDRMVSAEPMLAQLAGDQSLRGLFELLEDSVERAIADEQAPDGLTDLIAAIRRSLDATLKHDRPVLLSWEELFDLGGGVSETPARIVITARPQLDFAQLLPARAAVEQASALAEAVERAHDGRVQARVTGRIALNAEEMESAYATIYRSGALSLLLVAIILGVGLRSFWLVGAIIATLVVGLVWTAALAALTVEALNLMSVAFAVLFIGLGVDFAIHVCLRFREELAHSRGAADALERIGGPLGRALALCAVSTSLAFYAFLPTPYHGLAQLGWISGTGVLIAFLASITFLPALLACLPAQVRLGATPWAHGAPRGPHHRRAAAGVLALAACAVLAALIAIPASRFETDRMKLRDMSTPAAQAFEDLLSQPDTSPYAIQLLVDGREHSEAMAARLERLAEVDATVTIESFVPEDQAEKLLLIQDAALLLMPVFDVRHRAEPPDDAQRLQALRALRRGALAPLAATDGAELRELRRAAAPLDDALAELETRAERDAAALGRAEVALLELLPHMLERLERALEAAPVARDDLPRALATRYVAEDGTHRVEVRPAENVREERALRAFVRAVQNEAPAATGAPVVLVESAEAVMGSIRSATLYAAVLVIALLLTAYRRVGDVALSLVPTIFALLLTVAATVVLDMPFNFANVVVLPLVVGIGVDSAIHMVMRARELASETRLLESSTPRAVLLSALTTAGSFGTLALSAHRGISSMGVLLTLALALIVLGIRVVLPALMTFLPPAAHGPASADDDT